MGQPDAKLIAADRAERRAYLTLATGCRTLRHPSSVAALLRRVDARTCAITRAKFPLPGNERTPFIIPNSAGLQRFQKVAPYSEHFFTGGTK